VAGLLGTVVVLLVAGLVGSTAAALHFRRIADSETAARQSADRARAAADVARAQALAAQREADARRHEAEASRAEAQRQSKAAEASYARARRAVDDSFTQVSESKLLNVPGLRALRADLLGSALTFYEELLKEHGDDPALRRDLLATRLKVARVRGELGQGEASRAAAVAAADGFERALRERPDDPDLKAGLAEALTRSARGSADARVARFHRAVVLREEVLRAKPGDLENKAKLAGLYNSISVILHEPSAGQSHYTDTAESLAALERSAILRLELAVARPDDPEVLDGLATAFNNVGVTSSSGNPSWEETLPLFQQAVGFTRESLRLRPNDVRAASSLRVHSGNVSTSLSTLGRGDEAIAEARASFETFRALARQNPEAPDFHSAYINASQNLARLLSREHRPDEAVGALLEASRAFDRLSRETGDEIAGIARQRLTAAEEIGRIKADLTPVQKAGRDALVDGAVADYREAVSRGAGFNPAPLTGGQLLLLKAHPGFATLMAEAEAAAEARAGRKAGAGPAAVTGPGPQASPPRGRVDVRLARATLGSGLGLAMARARGTDGGQVVATLDRARALFDELARQRPGDAAVERGRTSLRLNTLAALHALSLAALKAGRAAEADGYRKRADALFEELHRARPGGPEAAEVRGGALVDLAVFHREAGRWPEAYRALREADDVVRRALSSSPDEANTRPLAAQLDLIADAYARLGLIEEAATASGARFAAWFGDWIGLPAYHRAMFLLLDDDIEGYRRHGARLLEVFGTGQGRGDAQDLVRSLTLHPGAVPDWRPVSAAAEAHARLVAGSSNPWKDALKERADVRAGRPAEALRSMKAGNYYPMGWPFRALAHLRLGETGEARAWLRRTDGLVRDDIEKALAGRGFAQRHWQRWEHWCDAVILGREAHAAVDGKPWPDAAWMRLQRARALARVGEAARSDALFSALLAERPDDAEVWLGRAQADAWLGRFDRARVAAARSARLGPGTALGWETLGRAFADGGRAADAAGAFARAVELARGEPADDRDDLLRRAAIWVALDRPEEASADLTRALDLSRRQGDPAVEELLGRVDDFLTPYLRDRRWGAALALVRGLSGVPPTASAPNLAWRESALARIISALYAITGDRAGFTRHMTAVLDGVRRGLGPYPAAELVVGATHAAWPAGDPERVVELAEGVNARLPVSMAPYCLAMAHLRAGRPENALERIAEADRTPAAQQNARPLIDLVAAIAHQRLGHAAEARRLYDDALRWFQSQRGEPLGWWPNQFLTDALSYESLRREAEALIVLDPTLPADPFTR
jgi:tetratricopeptide (TPR) repeat protein